MTSFTSALYKGFVSAGPVFFGLWLMAAPPALAQGTAQPAAAAVAGDPFTVEGVVVDVTAGNAVKAREQALGEAQVKAFEQLAQRSLPPEQRATYTMPDADTVMALVKDFEVTNEQLSATRYKGTFTVRFRPALARRYLAPAPQQAAAPLQQVPSPATGAYQGGDPRTAGGQSAYAGQQVPQPGAYASSATPPQHAAYQYQAEQARAAAMQGTPVTVRARFANIQEWVRLKNTLERNRVFPLRRVIALRPREALIELAYNGSIGDLQQALTGAGLSAGPAHSVSMDANAPALEIGFNGYSRY